VSFEEIQIVINSISQREAGTESQFAIAGHETISARMTGEED
jgi:hypothetical protein